MSQSQTDAGRYGGSDPGGILTLASPAQADPNNNSAAKLTKAVTLQGVLRHLDAFQAIADGNGGNRASGQAGYDASADYAAGLLEDAGYEVTRQPFPFNFFEGFGSSFTRTAPAPVTNYVDGADYDLVDLSGSGDVTGPVVEEEEVPRGGVSIERRWQAARWTDGSMHVWLRRSKQPGPGERSSGVRWDSLDGPTTQ